MVTFKVRGSAVSKLQSHYEETVYVLPQSPQKFLIPIWPASEEKNTDSSRGFELGTPAFGIQRLNHWIALCLERNLLFNTILISFLPSVYTNVSWKCFLWSKFSSFFVIKRLGILFLENTDINRQKLKLTKLPNISHCNITIPSTKCFLAVQAHCESVFYQSCRFSAFSNFYDFFESNKEIISSSLYFPC